MTSVDVIIPCYGYARFLNECVNSVLSQHGVTVRILILNDASPDNTTEIAEEIASRDSRVEVVNHTKNKGHIASYNEGIEWASADYLLLLSADDYLLPGALTRAASAMDANPAVAFTFGGSIQLYEGGAMRHIDALPVSAERRNIQLFTGPEFIRRSGATNMVATATAVVRTAMQKRLGGYRPDLPHSGDLEMWLRFAAHGAVAYIEAFQAVYRIHRNNMSLAYRAAYNMPDLEQRLRALEVFLECCAGVMDNPQQVRRVLFRSLACEAVCCASAAFNEGETGAANQLTAFAVSLSPDVTRSLAWLRFKCKRLLGHRLWNVWRSRMAGTS
jgi:GT2 family glycosyltransferase